MKQDLITLLRKGIPERRLKKRVGGKKNMERILSDLLLAGYDIQVEERGKNKIYRIVGGRFKNGYEIDLPENFIFGIVSDTHIGSSYSRIDYLKEFYDFLKREGAMFVLFAGDMIDGVNVYKGQAADLELHTIEEQVEKVILEFPKGLKTYAIAGNHDLKMFEGGYSPDPLKMISEARKDIEYIGRYYARLERDLVWIDLVHPSGSGNVYAISYPIQKYIRNIEKGDEPEILIVGHWHRAFYLEERGIEVIGAGCFMGTSPYLKRKGLVSKIAGWLIEGKHDGESVRELRLKRKVLV